MTVLREPESIEDAVRQAVALLGEAAVCAAADYSGAAVRAWSNRDDRRGIPFEAALALDRALRDEGYPAVFAQLAMRKAHEAVVPMVCDPETAQREALAAVAKTIDDSGASIGALCRSAADGRLNRSELLALHAVTERWKKSIDQARRKIFQALRSGAPRPAGRAVQKGNGR